MDEQIIKNAFAKKLAYYRKSAGLTQADLAEKLNYSDKSVSKWERAEGIPDVFVLSQIAEIFSVGVDDLINESRPMRPVDITRNRRLITFISAGAAMLIAAIVFATLKSVGIAGVWPWLCFVYALPVCSIILIVFTAMWWGKKWLCVSISALLWTLVLSFLLTFGVGRFSFFLAAAAVSQILVILIFSINYRKNKT